MTARMQLKLTVAALLAAAVLTTGIPLSRGEQSPFDIDIKELDKQGKQAAPLSKKPAQAAQPARKAKAKSQKQNITGRQAGGAFTRYTIKHGDHLFKILVRHFGMANDAAEALIPEILRLNDISDIRKLTVGRTILIPHARHGVEPEPAVKAARVLADAPSRGKSSSQQAAPTFLPQTSHNRMLAEAAGITDIAVRSLKVKEANEIIDSLLNILAMKWYRNHIVEASGRNRFSVKVDRYVEGNGQRYILSLSTVDPFTYTLYRLLELEGYKLVSLNPADDFVKLTSALLSQLNIAYRYGEHALVLNDKNHTTTQVNGFLFIRGTVPPRLVLVTESPVPALTAQLRQESKGTAAR